ncbi:uncharacterized protein DUF4292 [Ulvibacter sp. MAR_2010_11]|uniref:DUF4292 domain-containing protein n=1 Tax=Ulvibacter sp. MAR_2010_11 TaxID=1250229 RepID=UPI000CA82D13|nr:DUF4292 domain-containing protein [Ulvibacter sp. MAR_2010_11]PKA82884.1 uncharacterized protein DUF4292 [Ulvibacter sp. MAR_2010_11]
MHKLLYLLFLVVVLSSCGGTKGITGSNKADKSFSAKKITESHAAASPNFSTLAGRLQVVYEDNNKLQSITVSLRMEKDKIIWVKASLLGITIAKVLITPDRVSYYETIGSTYFDGDFSLLSEWLGTDIDFEKAQAILLGQSMFNLNTMDYTVKVAQNQYQLSPKQQPQNFIHYLFLNPENFKVVSGSLSQPNDSRLLSIRYRDYQKIDGGFYPSDILINASEKESTTKIELNYKKIELNVSVSFPFTIPEGYEEIQL